MPADAQIPIPPAAPLPGELAGPDPLNAHPALAAKMLRALAQIDPAIARWSRAQRRRDMLKRLWHGVRDHFRLRATEWLAAAFLLQLGSTLYLPPDAFPTSQSWDVMARQMPEEVWGAILLCIGALRVAALTVNGTFRGFRFSPHIRCATAFVAVGLWLQIVMSIYQSSPHGTGYGAYRLVLILELWNVWCSGIDVGIVRGRHQRHG